MQPGAGVGALDGTRLPAVPQTVTPTYAASIQHSGGYAASAACGPASHRLCVREETGPCAAAGAAVGVGGIPAAAPAARGVAGRKQTGAGSRRQVVFVGVRTRHHQAGELHGHGHTVPLHAAAQGGQGASGAGAWAVGAAPMPRGGGSGLLSKRVACGGSHKQRWPSGQGDDNATSLVGRHLRRTASWGPRNTTDALAHATAWYPPRTARWSTFARKSRRQCRAALPALPAPISSLLPTKQMRWQAGSHTAYFTVTGKLYSHGQSMQHCTIGR